MRKRLAYADEGSYSRYSSSFFQLRGKMEMPKCGAIRHVQHLTMPKDLLDSRTRLLGTSRQLSSPQE